jgi:hypothetical protein
MILALILVLALAAAVVGITYADMAIDEPGCPAALGLDL